ncbi:recombinase family protein [Streptomyces sp. NBC_00467]|uniref:recombinase family protein n=1 Tax=Streptomyces sp. NBC_00467 TaxID=2975752 RepID=UPI002E1718CB
MKTEKLTPSWDTPRAFIYDRHATATTTILDIRLDRCRAYAISQGWDIAGMWLDLGDHALGHHRPQFHALCMAMQETHGPAICLVDDWDRLTRDPAHGAAMRDRVRLAGGHCETAQGETNRSNERAHCPVVSPQGLPLRPLGSFQAGAGSIPSSKEHTVSTPSSPPVPDPPGSPIPAASARRLLSDAEFNAVLATILVNNPGMQIEMGGRILAQALAFVATAASKPGQAMTPSRVVDEGWHTLILHTGLYYRLCARFGNFVHHIPEQPDPSRFDQTVIDRTTALIAAAGWHLDPDLWRGPAGSLIPVAANCQHSDDSGPIVIIPKPKG